MSVISRESFAAIPQPARVLGLSGLIPFVLSAIVAAGSDAPLADNARLALMVYGAVILSFLGGVRWGVMLQCADHSPWQPWINSVLPSILAWVAVLIGGGFGLFVLILGFCAQWVYDMRAVRQGNVPNWFAGLRTVLTLGAVLSLALGALTM